MPLRLAALMFEAMRPRVTGNPFRAYARTCETTCMQCSSRPRHDPCYASSSRTHPIALKDSLGGGDWNRGAVCAVRAGGARQAGGAAVAGRCTGAHAGIFAVVLTVLLAENLVTMPGQCMAVTEELFGQQAGRKSPRAPLPQRLGLLATLKSSYALHGSQTGAAVPLEQASQRE